MTKAANLAASANATAGNVTATNIQSNAAGTPTVFQDSAGTQVGTLCRAWVNFNPSSGTAVIRSSFNVSSVTVSGTGLYILNFTNALPDANYSIVGMQNYNQDGADNHLNVVAQIRRVATPLTTTTAYVACSYNQTALNPTIASFAVFR